MRVHEHAGWASAFRSQLGAGSGANSSKRPLTITAMPYPPAAGSLVGNSVGRVNEFCKCFAHEIHLHCHRLLCIKMRLYNLIELGRKGGMRSAASPKLNYSGFSERPVSVTARSNLRARTWIKLACNGESNIATLSNSFFHLLHVLIQRAALCTLLMTFHAINTSA